MLLLATTMEVTVMEHAVWALVLALDLESPRLQLARVATLGVKMTVGVADHTRSPRLHLDPPPRLIDVF
jgi:hypothetical protein